MNEVKTSDIKEQKELPYQEIKPKTDLTAEQKWKKKNGKRSIASTPKK
ncbi:hypothetical protein ABE547_03475 [Dorea sp. YH-dor226]